MVSAWDSSWLSMPLPDHLSCLSPPLPALGSGTGLSTQEMFKIQVLKCEELAGGGCPGGLCHAGDSDSYVSLQLRSETPIQHSLPSAKLCGAGRLGWSQGERSGEAVGEGGEEGMQTRRDRG